MTSESVEDTTQPPPVEVQWKPEYAVALANLANDLDLEDVLPKALYGCSQLGTEIIDGLERVSGEKEKLSPSSLKRCLVARSQLVVTQSRIMSDAHFSIAACDCEYVAQDDKEQCLGKTLAVETQPFCQDVNVWDPLRRLDVWWKGIKSLSLCGTCLATAGSFYRDTKARILKELPEIFSLVAPLIKRDEKKGTK